MRTFQKTALLTISVLAFAGCASSKTKAQLAAETQQQPVLQNSEQVEAAVKQELLPGLTADQQARVLHIQEKVKAENAKIRTEMGQTQSLLIKKLSQPNSKLSDIDYLKKRMSTLSKERLNVMFTAIDETEKVLGRYPQKETVYQKLMEGDPRWADDRLLR